MGNAPSAKRQARSLNWPMAAINCILVVLLRSTTPYGVLVVHLNAAGLTSSQKILSQPYCTQAMDIGTR